MSSARIRAYLRRHHLALIALFLGLGGAAYAADGPLAGQNTVGSADIINAEVQTADLGAGAVRTGKVLDGSLRGADVGQGALTGAEFEANGLGGADIDEATLDSDSASAAADPDGLCDPGASPVTCVSTSLETVGGLKTAGDDVLVTADGGWIGVAGFGAVDVGGCELLRDGRDVGDPFSFSEGFGQAGDEHNAPARADGFAISGVDVDVPGGTHPWQLSCKEVFGNIQFIDTHITAMRFR